MTASLLKLRAIILGEAPNKIIQSSALGDVLSVLEQEAVAAFLVLHTIASMATALISFLEAMLASLEALNLGGAQTGRSSEPHSMRRGYP